jgi:hypothetical protein
VSTEGAILQFQVGGDWLAGKPTSFTVIPSDLAFYGTVPIALVAGVDAAWTLSRARRSRRGPTASGCTPLPSSRPSRASSSSCAATPVAESATPWLGAAFLMLYPLWLGYGLFDYKDGPTAFFLLLLVYCSGRGLENNGRISRWTAVAALATIALGGTKLAALSLGGAVGRPRRRCRAWPPLGGSPAAALGVVAGLIIVTPASWPDPLAFSKAAVELMSRHPWPGASSPTAPASAEPARLVGGELPLALGDGATAADRHRRPAAGSRRSDLAGGFARLPPERSSCRSPRSF